jgi:hypothetical protein
MNPTLHFFVARSRLGWSVNLESDRLCDHVSAEQARECAARQAEIARREGARASFVDLSRTCSG